ncbi:hypothetical protein K1T71_002243 [Dendrolimus kikuchii]|uniref:Uncharacterized protein n=1 Tax=Dendrolimus kikuchii TaxID=765133 RepID=A0ACC1DCJ5_9NEOP|nr:hypothetical protein K1T71_002243 [Dendrolimus kikuchii]
MVGGDQFPLFRLGTLVVRQLSAPVAARIKEYARRHPAFSRAVCMRTARTYRAGELRLKLWSLRLKQPRHLPPISDRQALDTGADILGEAVVFGLGAVAIVFEVNRQAMRQEAKALEVRSHWEALLLQLEELRREVALQQADLERLHAELQARVTLLDDTHAPIPHL